MKNVIVGRITRIDCGMTLIEVLVAAAILFFTVYLMGVTLPQMTNTARKRVNADSAFLLASSVCDSIYAQPYSQVVDVTTPQRFDYLLPGSSITDGFTWTCTTATVNPYLKQVSVKVVGPGASTEYIILKARERND